MYMYICFHFCFFELILLDSRYRQENPESIPERVSKVNRASSS